MSIDGSFENEALENEDRSTKHSNLENEAPKTRKRSGMDFVDLWRCGRIRYLHLIQVLRFRVLGSSFSRFRCFVFDLGCFVFEFWVLRFRGLGASFSRFGCFVLRSSFSGASFSTLIRTKVDLP